MNSWVVVLGVGLGLIGAVGIILLLLVRASGQPSQRTGPVVSQSSIFTSESKPAPTVGQSDLACPTSSGNPRAGGQPAATERPEPYTHTTWFVKSNDGIHFTIEQKLAEHASVPEIVQGPDGTLFVYAVDFSLATGDSQERLVMMSSKDHGNTWTEPMPICLFDKTTVGAAVDPSIVVLPDGRFRLYYFGFGPPGGSTAKPDPKTDHKFYSAISTDGRSFAEEEGVRFQGQTITDPEVVQVPDGSWLMYISNGQETLITTSPDGLTFTDTRKTVSGGGVPGALVLPDGAVRWYGCSRGGIVTATAADGFTFSTTQTVSFTPKPTHPMICDPAVSRLPDGSLIGVIKTAPNQADGRPNQLPPGQPSPFRL